MVCEYLSLCEKLGPNGIQGIIQGLSGTSLLDMLIRTKNAIANMPKVKRDRTLELARQHLLLEVEGTHEVGHFSLDKKPVRHHCVQQQEERGGVEQLHEHQQRRYISSTRKCEKGFAEKVGCVLGGGASGDKPGLQVFRGQGLEGIRGGLGLQC